MDGWSESAWSERNTVFSGATVVFPSGAGRFMRLFARYQRRFTPTAGSSRRYGGWVRSVWERRGRSRSWSGTVQPIAPSFVVMSTSARVLSDRTFRRRHATSYTYVASQRPSWSVPVSRPPWPASRMTRTPARDLGPRELGRLGLLPRPLERAGVVLGEEFLREDLHGNLHGEPDGDRVDVGDSRALRELQGQLVHVRGVEAARDAHDDGRVEGFPLAQPVRRDASLLVLSEDE